jgi:drug/metabolite transporter (DMT)-like permease
MSAASDRPSARWPLVLAFSLVYLSWGTTYLAIKVGVRDLPPGLFGGVRYIVAGMLLLSFLGLRREPLAVPRREWGWLTLSSLFLMVGGNGLINLAETTVDSGVASVLAATTPLWLALLETIWPWGEKLSGRGWLGVFLGLGGVLVLLAPRLDSPARFLQESGPLLVLASAACWAAGSFILRHQRRSSPPLATAAYQMILGGSALSLVGLAAGEGGQLSPEHFTSEAVFAFFYLLIVGSLIGFVAYTWLLARVSATLAGTYAYVNPVVAILVAGLLGREEITGGIIGGMLIILAGVALVRVGGTTGRPEPTQQPLASGPDEEVANRAREPYPTKTLGLGRAPH